MLQCIYGAKRSQGYLGVRNNGSTAPQL